MKPDIRTEHEWLQKLVGEWEFEPESVGPNGEVEGMSGSESVRMLGETWALCEMQVGIPGEEEGWNIMTLGYDPEKERFVGTFVSSMMTNLWVYEGELDTSGTTLALEAEGPSFAGDGGTSKYVDRIELIGEDQRVLSSSVLDPDGQWREFMRMRYRRNRCVEARATLLLVHSFKRSNLFDIETSRLPRLGLGRPPPATVDESRRRFRAHGSLRKASHLDPEDGGMALVEARGTVSHARESMETRGALSGGPNHVHGGIQTRQVLTFRIDGRPVQIKLTSAASLSDGDQVHAIGKEKNGVLHARALRNETTGAIHSVEAWRLYGLGAFFMVLGLPAMTFPPVGIPVFLAGLLMFLDSRKTTRCARRLRT